jgi:hypothetical protein
MTEFVRDYWPQYFSPKVGNVRFDYAANSSLAKWTAVYYYDPATAAMKLDSYDANAVWEDSWYLQSVVGSGSNAGVWEIQDNLPQTNAILALIFGKMIIRRYRVPIWWGNAINIGTIVSNRPSLDTFRCVPPQSGTGFQAIAFEQMLDSFVSSTGVTYHNVLVMLYQQTWPGGTTSGARMWMAKGIGPVANQWVAGSVVEPRQDAVVTYLGGAIA